MRVLVCGGRDFTSFSRVCIELDKLDPQPTLLISGHARGADQLAEQWAKENRIPARLFPADWDKYGKRAGYLRNVKMLEEGNPDLVVAFPGGKGTNMMVSIAESADIPIIKIT